ncbi:hypothetical protein HK102_005869, partial [Quaeritorhiza haematococci]
MLAALHNDMDHPFKTKDDALELRIERFLTRDSFVSITKGRRPSADTTLGVVDNRFSSLVPAPGAPGAPGSGDPFQLAAEEYIDDEPRKSFLDYMAMIFPIVNQLRQYNRKTFGADIFAALTVAFVLVPQAIAYSGLARVSPISALVSAIFPVMVYAIFGASRQLSLGPEALSSVLVGQAVVNEVERHGATAAQVAAILTFMVGMLCLFLAVLQAGFIDSILSGYILTGFVLGVANLIMVEQLPEIFGLHAHPAGDLSTIGKISEVVHKFDTRNTPTIIVAICNIAFLIIIQRIKKHLQHKARTPPTTPPSLRARGAGGWPIDAAYRRSRAAAKAEE